MLSALQSQPTIPVKNHVRKMINFHRSWLIPYPAPAPSNYRTGESGHSKKRRTGFWQGFLPNKTVGIYRFARPLSSLGDEDWPEGQRKQRTRQTSAPDESGIIDKRSPITFSDENPQRRPSKSASNWVTENTSKKQTNQTGWWNTSLQKTNALR